MKKRLINTLAAVTVLAAGMSTAIPAQAATITSSQRTAILNAHNAERNCGSRTLTLNTKLNNSSQAHATDMANRNYFSHSTMSPFPYPYSSSTWYARMSYWGVQSGSRAENIAYGFSTVTGVMNAWMNSAGHRANILDCDLRYMGVGFNSDGNYWVVDFTG